MMKGVWMTSIRPYIATLLDTGPAGVRRWMDGGAGANKATVLLGIAQGAASCARSTLSLDWLEVAIELYERLAQVEGKGEAGLLAAMHLRAYFIVRLGAGEAHPLLNVSALAEWFRRLAPFSPEEAAARAERWTERPIEQIRELRDLKNRLAVFEELNKAGLLNQLPDIRDWLAIRKQLP